MEFEEPTEEWQKHLTSWKDRRKSHSSNQKLDDEFERSEEELGGQGKPRTYKEMTGDRNQRGITSTYPMNDDNNYLDMNRYNDNDEIMMLQNDDTFNQNSEKSQNLNRDGDSWGSRHSGDYGNNFGEHERKRNSSAEHQNVKFYEKVIRISQRPNHEKGFGFSISGGREYGVPFVVEKVVRGGSADICELKTGDEIIAVNGVEVSQHYSESVKKVLDQSIATGSIELKVRRVRGADADEEIFSDEDEFEKPRPKSNLQYSESLSSHRSFTPPPPTPPHNLTADEDSLLSPPPPLPAVPPPPPNWNTFPGEFSPSDKFFPPPMTTDFPVDDPELLVGQTIHDHDLPGKATGLNGNDSDKSREDILRKRFEFLGLKPEHSEELKAIQEDKEKKLNPPKIEIPMKIESTTKFENSYKVDSPLDQNPWSVPQPESLSGRISPTLRIKSEKMQIEYVSHSAVGSNKQNEADILCNRAREEREREERERTEHLKTSTFKSFELGRSQDFDLQLNSGHPEMDHSRNVGSSFNPERFRNKNGAEETGPNAVAAWKKRDEEIRKQEELDRQMQEQRQRQLKEQKERHLQEQQEREQKRQIQEQRDRERQRQERERHIQEQREWQILQEQERQMQEQRDQERQIYEREKQAQEMRELQIKKKKVPTATLR